MLVAVVKVDQASLIPTHQRRFHRWILCTVSLLIVVSIGSGQERKPLKNPNLVHMALHPEPYMNTPLLLESVWLEGSIRRDYIFTGKKESAILFSVRSQRHGLHSEFFSKDRITFITSEEIGDMLAKKVRANYETGVNLTGTGERVKDLHGAEYIVIRVSNIKFLRGYQWKDF